MIKFSNEEGFIKSEGVTDLNGHKGKDIVLPHVAVGVFTDNLYEYMVEKYNGKRVATISLIYARPVHIINYHNHEITLFQAGASGPWISADLEDLGYNGVDTFIIFGNCGVLDSKIEDCKVIIPTKAYREEGTSYHYVPESETIDLSDEYKDLFIDILQENNYEYVEGPTWTTDALFRETKEKVKHFQDKGCICVEMEGATIAAVAKYKKQHYFTFYYAGDCLDGEEWDKRSFTMNQNFEKKKSIPSLAIDLALKILENENK